MSPNFESYLGAVTRTVTGLEREGKPTRNVTLERTYDTAADDLWDAVTNPERLPRWFLPVSGDLRPGGKYEFEGNAGGTISDCVPPRFLSVTWEFAGGVSRVEVRIAAEGDARSRGADQIDEEAFAASDEGRAYISGASEDWRRAAVESGEDAARAETAAKRTTAFYTGLEAQDD